MGFLEIVGDQTVKRAEEKGTIITHLFISLLIFCACNIFILVHVIYITQYVLRVGIIVVPLLATTVSTIPGLQIPLAPQLSLLYLHRLGNNFSVLYFWKIRLFGTPNDAAHFDRCSIR